MLSARYAIVLSALTVTVAGCQTTTMPEGGLRIDQQNLVRPALNSVRVIDSDLARYKNRNWQVRSVLDVENVTVSDSGTGFKRVSVELRNKASVEIPLEVRTSWYDASGRPVDPAQSWTRVFAKPMAMAVYEHVASKPTASQYYVEVRGAQ